MVMAYNQYFQYGQQWTPMYSNYFSSNNDYNWDPNQPQNNPQQFSYKPAAVAQTFDVEADDEVKPSNNTSTNSKRRSWFSGIQSTLRLYVLAASVVLAINIFWLIYAKARYDVKDGYGTIQEGSCAATKRLNIGLHFLINVLSTLLLTGSNIVMATYSAPTRREIDKAHGKRRWLHIGSMSFRNLRHIAFRKAVVVLILALSSIPFHFLYNSVVFDSLSVNSYYYLVVTDAFLSGSPYTITVPDKQGVPTYPQYGPDLRVVDPAIPENVDRINSHFDNIQKSASSWERLDAKACLHAYSNVFLSTRRDLVLVSTSSQNATDSLLEYGLSVFDTKTMTSNWWMCSMPHAQDGGDMYCNPSEIDATSWTVDGYPIDHCYSEIVPGNCSVQFSMTIMTVMVAFNAIKLAAMMWVVLRFNAESILASVGDAVASFIQHPDYTTSGMCLADRRWVRKFWSNSGIAQLYDGSNRRHWGLAVTKRRVFLLFFVLTVAFGAILMAGILGFQWTKARGVTMDVHGLWSLGFGTVTQYTMAIYNGFQGPFTTVAIIANIPQIFLAAIYLLYAGIMNAMFIAADWAKFATTPQALMVSTPKGDQRGTWLLGTPFKWGFSLLVLQTLLHWFVSQSIFVVQVRVYDVMGALAPPSASGASNDLFPLYNNLGYSPVAIIFSVVACLVLIFIAIVCMCRRFPVGSPPVASTCSAAISAACHVPPMVKGKDMIFGELRWGATAAAPNGIGHCSFAPAYSWQAGRVAPPVTGWSYAGLPEELLEQSDAAQSRMTRDK